MRPICPDDTPGGDDSPGHPARRPQVVEATLGSMLCRVRVWTDEEWSRLPEARRPLAFEHVPGLGWVGALPITLLN